VVDEDPDIENKDHSYSKSPKLDLKKTEVKHFPVETVKVESKKVLEDIRPKLIDSGEVKGVNLSIPEPAKILKSEDSDSSSDPNLDSDSKSSDSSFGLGMGSKPKILAKAQPKQTEFKLEKPDHDFGFEFSSSKPETKDNRLKPIQKVIQIDDDDDDFGLFSKPEPKSLAKPLSKPAIFNPKQPEKIVVNQESEEIKWSFECYEMFVDEEIDFCVKSLQSPKGTQIVKNKIPSSIKGSSFQKLMAKNSSSHSDSESSSNASNSSFNFDDHDLP
jgi:hypothetical protein